MYGNGFEINSNIYTENELSFLETTQNLDEHKQELQNEKQYFEYKNRSNNGKFFVFSYNAITGDKINDIKQKFVDQYGGNEELILITDSEGRKIINQEFKEITKIYLKVSRNDNPHPIIFHDVNPSNDGKIVCYIKNNGWTTHNIKQMYQDQVDKVIPEDDFILLDSNNKPYNNSFEFEPGDVIYIKIKTSQITKKSSQKDVISDKKMSVEASIYNDMIENQKIPLSHGNKNKSEISITFDDGYGNEYIKNILEILRLNGIKATFFLLGDCIKKSKDLWKQAIKDGHQICCHTYSHAYLGEGQITELFKGHGIPVKNRSKLINAWKSNVQRLLGVDYLNEIISQNPGFPELIDSVMLLETEILMREEEVKQSLGEQYLSHLKLNHPFFRFPGGCGSKRPENIDILKKHGYLAIGWNKEPTRSMKSGILNGDIPLFHFNKKNIDTLNTYIIELNNSGKIPKLISEIIVP